MIIFLYGEDTYRSRQKLNEVIKGYKKTHGSGLNFKVLDLKKNSYEKFKNDCSSVSMFEEKKLFVLKNVFDNKSFQKKFLKNKKEYLNSNNIIVFYSKKKGDKRKKFFKFLTKKAKTQEFKPLKGEKLSSWIEKEIKNKGAEISSKGLETLTDYIQNDLWRASNEINKLVNYKNGKKIRKEDVVLLVKPKIKTDIFETIDALAKQNKKKAFRLIHKHLEDGDSPLYLLSMINYQFRNLLSIKDLKERGVSYSKFKKITGLHPYVIKKSNNQAGKFKIKELKKIYNQILIVDQKIKTGKVKAETGLDLLIEEIINY
ncbi:MAG: DNA polymerase III subunit delta [Minisyncoccales bacterium]